MNPYGCSKYVYITSEDYILSLTMRRLIRPSNLSGNDNAPLGIGNEKHCFVLKPFFVSSNIIDFFVFSLGTKCDDAEVRERR